METNLANTLNMSASTGNQFSSTRINLFSKWETIRPNGNQYGISQTYTDPDYLYAL